MRAGQVTELKRSIDLRVSGRTAQRRCGPVVFELNPGGMEATGLRALGIEWRSMTGRPAAYRLAEGEDGSLVVEVESGCCRADLWVLVAREWISNAVTVAPSRCGQGDHADLVPTPVGLVTGRLAGSPRGGEVRGGIAVVGGCSAAGHSTAVPITVEDEGSFSLPAPVGCSDLTLSFPGYAPVAVGTVQVAAGTAINVGNRVLSPAASILVRVVDGETGLPIEGVRSYVLGSGDLAGRRAARALAGEELRPFRTSDAAGWCRVGGLGPGAYHLLAVADGYATALGDAITVREPVDLDLEDLRLFRPGALSIVVGGEATAGGVAGALTVAARHSTGCWSLPSLSRTVNVEGGGTVDLEGLAPGRWRVALAASDSDRQAYEIDSVEVTVEPGRRAEVELGAGGIEVSGSVSYRDSRVTATLLFSAQGSAAGRCGGVGFSSSDGRFSANLPGPGLYDVRVDGKVPAISCLLTDIEVNDDRGLELIVPAGRIEGVVVDEAGQPVADARVEAIRGATDGNPAHRRSLTTRSGNDGTWAVDDLLDGERALVAYHQERRSRPLWPSRVMASWAASSSHCDRSRW